MRKLLLGVCALATLVACSEPKPEPEPEFRAPKRRAPKRAPEPTPSQDPQPQALAPSTAPIADARPMSEWWCLCYQREGAAGPEPMTACRQNHAQCRKLESRVAKGSKEIIANSLTNGCRALTGRHPSDAAGTPEQWQPSALAGAWVSEGVCQLRAMAAAPEPETAPEPEPEEAVDFSFYQNELIGVIALGQDTATIRHALGEPVSKTTIEEEGATGDWVQTWTYPGGLSLDMVSSTRGGPQTVRAIHIEAPSKLETRRGVGIGTAREAVERAYGDVKAKDGEFGEDSFIAGSIYGGLFFGFTNDRVADIYLGPGAE